MAKDKAKMSAQEGEVMRVLFLDSGTYFRPKIAKHLDEAAEKSGVKAHHEAITPEDVHKYMQNDPEAGKKVEGAKLTRQQLAKYIGSFDYIVSSGAPENRKYDTAIHKFIKDNKKDGAILFGICHGAQQTAMAHEAKLTKGKKEMRGPRESKVKLYDPVLKGMVSDGKINEYAHHRHYIKSSDAGDLEILAEAESPYTDDKFVEIYRIGEDIYGIQNHHEEGEGKLLKNLYKKALKNKREGPKKIKIGPEKAEEVLEKYSGKAA